jgi:Zn-dependent protease
MAWSWKLGRLAGIQIRVHATFVLLVGWIFLTQLLQGHGVASAGGVVVFLIGLFGSVVLHELGHALTARRFGIGTRDITLLPIGGMARLDRMPHDPKQELWVALAGPAVNFILAAFLYMSLAATGNSTPLTSVAVTTGPLAQQLLMANLTLGVFNLIPAFPMDGGRVLRALLALRIDRPRATVIAANIGQGLALVFGAIGFFTNPMLVFIALFVWIGAAGELSAVERQSALTGMPRRRPRSSWPPRMTAASSDG